MVRNRTRRRKKMSETSNAVSQVAVEAEKRVVSPRLHHVNLKTVRLDEMIEWYGQVVGMQLIHKFPGGAWLTNDDANHRLALLASPNFAEDPARRNHAGLHHTAFEFPSVDDLLGTYVRVKRDHGYVPHMVLDHGMTLSFYFVDPDGNSVELQIDIFGDSAKSKEFMLSAPEFAANPIGEFCDPDALVDVWRGGADLDELHRRAYAGEFTPAEPPDLRADLG
jgi:catechol 2,3-dioxygenase